MNNIRKKLKSISTLNSYNSVEVKIRIILLIDEITSF